MLDKRWVFQNKECDPSDIRRISGDFGVPPIIASVLINRGITSADDIKMFLGKSLSNVHHPFLLKDAQKAAQRIKTAIDNGEKIVVYGDYDVDGITSTAIIYMFLSSQGATVDYYIPNRADEGYGINILALQKLRKSGASLLITVDCGITAVGEVEFAKTIGLDIVITDHHTCKEDIPRACAVVNPKQPDCTYPFKDLAGVGVAFKVILACALEMELAAREYFDQYIDLVAIGTIADVVPMKDENRIFAAVGVRHFAQTTNIGLKALALTSGISEKPVTAGIISYTIAPRINAAGRVASASLAVELLVTNSSERAAEISLTLENENRERQLTEQTILKEALEMIDADESFSAKKVIVLAKEDWHHGVIGVVASRIVDKFYRPTILLSLKDGNGKGSGRSIKGFNLFEALMHCNDLLIKFGGHELAAGLNLKYDDISVFDEQINLHADSILTDDNLIPYINIDAPISPHDLTVANAEKMSVLEPFGMGNPHPVFAITRATVSSIRTLSDGKHCKLTLTKEGRSFEVIGFGAGALAERIMVGDKLDIAFLLDINVYRGEKNVQLILKDARFSLK